MFGISLGVVSLAAVFYLLLRWGNERTQREVRSASGALRGFEAEYRQFLGTIQEFSPDDPEPYHTPAQALQTVADQLGQELYALRSAYVNIQQRLPHKTTSAGLWKQISPGISPMKLSQVLRELGILRQGLAQQRSALDEARRQAAALAGMGWQIAQRARQSVDRQASLDDRLQTLQQRRAHGAAFDSLVELSRQSQERLEQIPGYLLVGEAQSVLDHADKATVIAVHQWVGDAQPVQAQLEQGLQEWEARLTSLDGKLSRLLQGSDQVQQALDLLPAPVDTSEVRSQLSRIQADLQRLQVLASRPELDKLVSAEPVADQQIQAGQELLSTLRQASQGQAALEYSLANLAAGTKLVSEQYSDLGSARNYRILWSRTSNALADLSRHSGELGGAERKRTPGQLENDLEEANLLLVQQKELAIYFEQVSDQRAQLVSLLEGPELSQALLWAQNAPKVFQQIREYHPDNWPRADAVQLLQEDLRAVSDGLQRLGMGRPGDGIAETQLAQRLQEAIQIGQLYQELRVRVNAIEARLAALKTAEIQAREMLEIAQKNLAQVGFIINSNPVLVKLAGQEIERFQKQIEKQLGELGQRQQGTVDSKARQSQGLATRIEQGLNGWLDQLSLDNQAKANQLTATLTRLDSIAPLDDGQVAEARRLLSAGQPYGSAYGNKASYPLEALVLEYKRRSEYSQACAAASQALKDLEKPVVDSYTTASQARQQVQDQVNTANNWLRQANAWPPVAVNPETEFRALGKLEASWSALREKPIKAIELVKRLGDLAREYQSLAASLKQLIEQGNRDQAEILQMERELDGFLSGWEKLAR
ncbi:MAG: hypothetical protein MUE67_06405, partial [Anaerolineales bacterium]|nr:hypothetical protein [Anaerolineales bacterium]